MSLTKVSYSMITGASANVLDFGAVGDGTTNDSAAIQAAINSGASQIVYPKGTFLATNLTLVSDQRHIGEGATLLKPVDGFNLFSGVSVAEVEFNGLRFQSTDIDAHCISLQGTLSPASCCEDIKVLNCSVYGGIQLFATYQPAGTSYSTITDAMLAKNILVADNRCVGTNAAKTSGGIGAIAFYYAKDWIAQGNYVESFQHGITWWGGDATPNTGDGLLANTRKCYNGVINGNISRNMGGGGIWGAMGRQMAISGNTVRDCADVGIDLEGCLDSIVSGNYVQDCNNGCLVTYNLMYGVVFSGNECVSTVAGRNIVMHNIGGVSTQAGIEQSRDLVLDGNTFRCVEPTAVCSVTGGFIQNLIFTNNTLLNCVVSYTDDQYGGVRFDTFDGNKFTFDNTILTVMKVLESSNAHAGSVIRNNTFQTYANQQSNTVCIYQSSYSFATGESHEISGNSFTTYGGIFWDFNINCISDQTLPGSVAIQYQILNNRFAATNNFTRSATGNMRLVGNIDHLCRPVPKYTLPSTAPSGTWNAGQIAYVETPASAGYIGAVCTVDGTPGTWYTFGLIS